MALNYRELLIDYLGGKCADCEIEDVRVLELHHRDKDGKIDREKGITWKWYWENRDQASFWLQVLCCNHHKLKTLGDESGIIIGQRYR